MTDRVVVVVGGSSGIGLASAVRFAGLGDHLVLGSRSAEALDAAGSACRAAGAATVDSVVVDVRSRADVTRLVDRVLGVHGRVDVVVHTAAVMAYGTLEEVPADVFAEVLDTTVNGTAHVARTVLPVMRAQGSGVLIGVNSLLGSVTVPRMGAYAVAKWGQRAVLRTLQQETRGARGVHVCLISPGSINTPIYYQAANHVGRETRPPVPVLPPERVAAVIVRVAERPRKHVSVRVGPWNSVVITGYRLLPPVYDWLVGRLFTLAALTKKAVPVTTGNVHRPRPEHERVHGHWPGT